MNKLRTLALVLLIQFTFVVADEVKLSIGKEEGDENSTFVATDEWQEIKPGQRVPQGLHYRINVSTGKKEAKLLDPSEDRQPPATQLSATENQSEESEVAGAKKRLEEALKNIPGEGFGAEDAEARWREVKRKFRSYDEIKRELKDIDLQPQTEAEVLAQLMDEFANRTEGRLEVLRDLEHLLHSIDNALLFVERRGLETIVVPHLANQTAAEWRVVLLRIVGAISQNNIQAKKYICERTNLVNDLTAIAGRCEQLEELSAALFSIGSLARSNALLSEAQLRRLLTVLAEILAKDAVGIAPKVKTLLLVDDLVSDSHADLAAFVESSKLCQQLAAFLEASKSLLIADADAAEKTAAAFLSLSARCGARWSELPILRHTLLVIASSYRMRLSEEAGDGGEAEESRTFMHGLIVEHLENLNQVLYGELKISADDLSDRYRDEL